MSLDLKKLQNARQLPSGVIQARCPACAKTDSDKAGEHLRVYPDGRFGCCVHPKDREHRRQIFALAGERHHSSRTFQVRVTAAKPPLLPFQSVTACLTDFLGTLGTAVSKSVPTLPNPNEQVGTLGTPILKLRAYEKIEGTYINIGNHTCKDCESAVLSVPSSLTGEKLPYLLADGTLTIPFDSPERYHWWKGGQSVSQTKQEILERS
jgi:hypothetical protein